ncbi:uncharacterized protein LOC144906800 isoform X2 [Branchiostoma floridae x Branchiostoma belcheri]
MSKNVEFPILPLPWEVVKWTCATVLSADVGVEVGAGRLCIYDEPGSFSHPRTSHQRRWQYCIQNCALSIHALVPLRCIPPYTWACRKAAYRSITGNAIKMDARDSNPMYTHDDINLHPVDAKNNAKPNPMYLQSTIEPNVKPGPTMDPNPMYSHNTINPYPMDTRNDVSPSPMYLETPVEPPNASPESTIRSDENDDIPCTQASGDAHRRGDGANFSPANNDDKHCLQPYAITHREEVAPTTSIASDDEDIPYAAAYLCQGDMPCNTASGDTQTELSSQNQPAAASNNTNDNLGIPSSNDVPNALFPNPMYVPNVHHRLACGCTRRRLCLAVLYAAVVLGSCILCGVFLWLRFDTSPPPLDTKYIDVLTSTVDTTSTTNAAAATTTDLTTTTHTTTTTATTTTTTSTSSSTTTTAAITFIPIKCSSSTPMLPGEESGDKTLKKITFGGLKWAIGVAVSADNEIFVPEFTDRRVKVFSIKGAYLRLFPTVLPNENRKIKPLGVAVGKEPGYLWVVGLNLYNYVVQYGKKGQPIKMFAIRSLGTRGSKFPVIAIDARNNKVIVAKGNTVIMFNLDGSLYRSFNAISTSMQVGIGGVTSDCDGNILITLVHGYKTVMIMMYSHSGDKLFETIVGRGKELHYTGGICLDTLGRIIVVNIVNNRVDMFTSRGEFLRTIAHVEDPWGVALGPGGDLVVTSNPLRSYKTVTVTVFPRHMVLS